MQWVGWGNDSTEHCAGTVSHPSFLGEVRDSLLHSRSVWLHISDGGVYT